MAASGSGRWSVHKVYHNGTKKYSSINLAWDFGTLKVLVHLEDDELHLDEDWYRGVVDEHDEYYIQPARLFLTFKDPEDAESFVVSSLAHLRDHIGDEYCYGIIRRSDKHSTSPGKLTIPTGYPKKDDGGLQTCAIRILREELGDALVDALYTPGRPFAIIEDVPTSTCHNIIVVHLIDATPRQNSTLSLDIRFETVKERAVLQADKVDAFYFCTLDMIQGRLDEFTPQLVRMFGAMREEEGRVMWNAE